MQISNVFHQRLSRRDMNQSCLPSVTQCLAVMRCCAMFGATLVLAGCRDSVGEWRRLPGPRLQVCPWQLRLELLRKTWAFSFQNHKSGSETQTGQLCCVCLSVLCLCRWAFKCLLYVWWHILSNFFLHYNFYFYFTSLSNGTKRDVVY